MRIVAAARQEFSEHGIDGARIDEIVRRAGVSKQLFYYYFESKEEIYKIVLEQAAELSLNLILAQDYTKLSAEAALQLLLRRIFDQYIEMPFLIKFATDQDHHAGAHISARSKLRSLSPVLLSVVDAVLKRGGQAGEFRKNIDAEFFFTATILMLRGCFASSSTAAIVHGLRPDDRASQFKWREDVIEFALAAIRSRPDDPVALASTPDDIRAGRFSA